MFDIPTANVGLLDELMDISRQVVKEWVDEIKEEEQTNNDGNKNMDKVRLKTNDNSKMIALSINLGFKLPRLQIR
jgi:hypothetical protein